MTRVALYLRLSDEDRDKLTKEERSESIKNQEKMLRNYAYQHQWEIVAIYDDEDWSGADITRPNFKKMIDACRMRQIDVVLVKSQARFARDMEIVEKYVHNKFHEWNVRFVSLMEKIDNTRKETKKMSQIIGLTDEWFLEDTSHNIRQTLKSKRENGEYTGSFAPYGYQKDPENKNHLLPDLKVKPYIIRIFQEYNYGYGMGKIAKRLNQDGIPSPLEYKLMMGSHLKLPCLNSSILTTFSLTGSYLLRIYYYNHTGHIIRNLITLEYLTNYTHFYRQGGGSITLTKVKNEKIKFYYSCCSLSEINSSFSETGSLDFDNHLFWQPLVIGESLPEKATCIAVYTKELDRMNDIFYEFTITLLKNHDHIQYRYHIDSLFPYSQLASEYQIRLRKQYLWSITTIRKILQDEVYLGNLVQFKTTTVSYKNKTKIYLSEKERIRVENTHDAIIDSLLFQQVQTKLKQRKKCSKDGVVHLFAGKVFCSCCGRVFYKCGKKDTEGFRYLCCKDKVNHFHDCTNQKYIHEKELYDAVLNQFNLLLQKYYQVDYQLNLYQSLGNLSQDRQVEKELIALQQEKVKLCQEVERKQNTFSNLYEDFTKTYLSQKEFFLLRDKYRLDQEYLNKQLQLLEGKIQLLSKKRKAVQVQSVFEKYTQLASLSREIVQDFVEKILIDGYDPITNTRKIEITWNFD